MQMDVIELRSIHYGFATPCNYLLENICFCYLNLGICYYIMWQFHLKRVTYYKESSVRSIVIAIRFSAKLSLPKSKKKKAESEVSAEQEAGKGDRSGRNQGVII